MKVTLKQDRHSRVIPLPVATSGDEGTIRQYEEIFFESGKMVELGEEHYDRFSQSDDFSVSKSGSSSEDSPKSQASK